MWPSQRGQRRAGSAAVLRSRRRGAPGTSAGSTEPAAWPARKRRQEAPGKSTERRVCSWVPPDRRAQQLVPRKAHRTSRGTEFETRGLVALDSPHAGAGEADYRPRHRPLRHVRDASESELLIPRTPPPTVLARRMAIAARRAKARQLRGTSAGPRQRPREQACVDEEALPGRISPHAAITSPALHLRLPVWTHFRLPAWMRRPLPRWAPVVAAAIGGAFVAMLLQRGAGKQPQPAVTAAPPALLEAARPAEAHPPPTLPAA